MNQHTYHVVRPAPGGGYEFLASSGAWYAEYPNGVAFKSKAQARRAAVQAARVYGNEPAPMVVQDYGLESEAYILLGTGKTPS
jgi:hypothetical protein